MFRQPFDNVTAIARDSLCNEAFGHWKHPVFRQPFDNVTAIERDSLGNQAFLAIGRTQCFVNRLIT
jgi:hypothetical protein